MATRKEQLSPQQHDAIQMILDGANNFQVADKLGVHVETVRRWRKAKIFAREFVKNKNEAMETAKSILQTNATSAAQKLVDMIDDGNITRNQYNASIKVLEMSFQFAEIDEMRERIAKLEAGVNREP